jgi:phthalate 4,5-dioxygenase oxygenase subunit
MLSREENELLTRVEGDAPAGRMMCRYWFPALLAEELAPGAAVPVRMLGRELVARRGTDGAARVGAAPTREAGGLIWTYLGPADLEPPFPAFDWTALPREQLATFKFVERANYLQVVEGGLDSGHTLYLHRGFGDQKFSQEELARRAISSDLSPRFEAEDTAYGIRFAMIRTPTVDPERTKYVKITAFVFPSTCIFGRPVSSSSPTSVQIFVPIDDGHTMHYTVLFSVNGRPLDQATVRRELCVERGINLDQEYRPLAREENWWGQDRALMKRGDWTGIAGFPMQDVAVQESMGAIVDRTREHLGTTDIPIIRFRRRFIESIKRCERGEPPVGLDVPVPYERLRTEQRVIGIDEPWQQVGAFAGEFVPPEVRTG